MIQVKIIFGSQGSSLAEELIGYGSIEEEDMEEDDVRHMRDLTLDELEEAKPSIREFETQAEVDAYLAGISDMDGWMAWYPLDNEDTAQFEKGIERVRKAHATAR